MDGAERMQEEAPKVSRRVFGAVFIVVGYWMVQNFPDIIFYEFLGQSGGLILNLFYATIGFGLPILPVLIGSHFLFFHKKGNFESDGLTENVVPYRGILTGWGIFVVFMALTYFVDIFAVIGVFGSLALGLSLRDARNSKKTQVSSENE